MRTIDYFPPRPVSSEMRLLIVALATGFRMNKQSRSNNHPHQQAGAQARVK